MNKIQKHGMNSWKEYQQQAANNFITLLTPTYYYMIIVVDSLLRPNTKEVTSWTKKSSYLIVFIECLCGIYLEEDVQVNALRTLLMRAWHLFARPHIRPDARGCLRTLAGSLEELLR